MVSEGIDAVGMEPDPCERPSPGELCVLVGTDAPTLPEGLRQALEVPGLHGIDQIGDWDRLFSAIVDRVPDLVVIDRDFWRRVSGRRLNALPQRQPAPHTLIYCEALDARVISEAVGNGVQGCLPRDACASQWISAIKVLMRGDVAMPRGWLVRALENALHPRVQRLLPAVAGQELTEREAEVLRCVSSAMSNKEIARQLGISEATVKTHLHHVFSKLKVSRRALLMVGSSTAIQ